MFSGYEKITLFKEDTSKKYKSYLISEIQLRDFETDKEFLIKAYNTQTNEYKEFIKVNQLIKTDNKY